jgi:hypothetical protein
MHNYKVGKGFPPVACNNNNLKQFEKEKGKRFKKRQTARLTRLGLRFPNPSRKQKSDLICKSYNGFSEGSGKS